LVSKRSVNHAARAIALRALAKCPEHGGTGLARRLGGLRPVLASSLDAASVAQYFGYLESGSSDVPFDQSRRCLDIPGKRCFENRPMLISIFGDRFLKVASTLRYLAAASMY